MSISDRLTCDGHLPTQQCPRMCHGGAAGGLGHIYIPWHPHPSIQTEGPFTIRLGSKNIEWKTKEFKDNLARKINI